MQKSFQDAKHEIDEEIKLASEQRQHGIQKVLMIEHDQNQNFRQRQDLEVRQSQRVQSEQTQALVNIEKREIQKLVREEGKSAIASGEFKFA